jgi:hypothetical protein
MCHHPIFYQGPLVASLLTCGTALRYALAPRCVRPTRAMLFAWHCQVDWAVVGRPFREGWTSMGAWMPRCRRCTRGTGSQRRSSATVCGCVTVSVVPAQRRGDDGPTRCDRLLRDRSPVVRQVRPELLQRPAPTPGRPETNGISRRCSFRSTARPTTCGGRWTSTGCPGRSGHLPADTKAATRFFRKLLKGLEYSGFCQPIACHRRSSGQASRYDLILAGNSGPAADTAER